MGSEMCIRDRAVSLGGVSCKLPVGIGYVFTTEVQPHTVKRLRISSFRYECSPRGYVEFIARKVCMREEVHHENNIRWVLLKARLTLENELKKISPTKNSSRPEILFVP